LITHGAPLFFPQGVSGPIAFNEFGDLKYDPKGPRLYTVTEFGADGSIAVVRGE
jgi:hypothetical protein